MKLSNKTALTGLVLSACAGIAIDAGYIGLGVSAGISAIAAYLITMIRLAQEP